jgi:AraC family transcriptional regulator
MLASMRKSPLAIVSTGQQLAGFPCLETVSSATSPWRGFLLEKNILPPSELPPLPIPVPMASTIFGRKPMSHYRRENGQDRKWTTSYGDLVTLPVGECYSQHWDEPLHFMTISFEPFFLHNAVRESVGGVGLNFRPEVQTRDLTIQNLFFALSSELEAGCVAGPLLGETIAVSLAVALLQKYSDPEIKIRNYARGLSKRTLRLTIDYVHDHLDQDLRLAEVAAVAGISPYYFNKLFARSTGQTFHRYVIEQRIQKGKYLLAFTPSPLSEIALECGFAGQSHFTTAFTKIVGVTPKAFRMQTQQ